jgi:IS5 family transposase
MTSFWSTSPRVRSGHCFRIGIAKDFQSISRRPCRHHRTTELDGSQNHLGDETARSRCFVLIHEFSDGSSFGKSRVTLFGVLDKAAVEALFVRRLDTFCAVW